MPMISTLFARLLEKHPRLLLASMIYPFFAALGLGLALLAHLAWWQGLLVSCTAMLIVGFTAG